MRETNGHVHKDRRFMFYLFSDTERFINSLSGTLPKIMNPVWHSEGEAPEPSDWHSDCNHPGIQ